MFFYKKLLPLTTNFIYMSLVIVLVLLFIGVVFFLIEIFLLPGISIAGVIGGLFIGASIFCGYYFLGSTVGTLILVGGLIFFGIAIWWFMRSRALDKMALKTDIDSKIEPLKGLDIKVGDTGETMSRLAPMGKIKINGAIVEAKTNDDFIDPDEEIIVLQVFNTNVLVERIENKE